MSRRDIDYQFWRAVFAGALLATAIIVVSCTIMSEPL
jgi:hypothetical protein